ncbi:metalloregulator ArsR/SmtB family transcription factor [Aestuariibacter halophilus]|uniref:Metalloregulator ArsR/SmtB family transcription factor n=1 Tax=Fluctibacter halophilus TaxID=226011 RepID=A0ABS8GC01_9ALTE|nr:metalloregulator ArsR/SmtB family transcription factor [Aestuariibacter halophilus]MCC2618104.1 metalloregulator ArsR/SmtB family transcription factor [Aestuariibacter halophilus]
MDMQEMQRNATEAEQFLKLLANKNRLMVLCAMMEKECAVSELNETVPLTQSALSQHLAALRSAGLVTTRREAQTIYYSINDPRVKRVIDTLYSLFCNGDAE